MSKTYLEDYLAKHPNAELIDGYPLDTQSEQRFVLCVKQAGYSADCLIGDHPDCRDCWNSKANEGAEKKFASNCCFGEAYPGPSGQTVIGCTEDNVWCTDCIAASCKKYAGKTI